MLDSIIPRIFFYTQIIFKKLYDEMKKDVHMYSYIFYKKTFGRLSTT